MRVPAADAVLVLEPRKPSDPWVYLGVFGDLEARCGRCDAWWFLEPHLPLDGQLTCGDCAIREYAARMGSRLRL